MNGGIDSPPRCWCQERACIRFGLCVLSAYVTVGSSAQAMRGGAGGIADFRPAEVRQWVRSRQRGHSLWPPAELWQALGEVAKSLAGRAALGVGKQVSA